MITDLDQLQETLSRKLNLYQQCNALTQRVADVIEAEDGVLVMKLLKQRDSLFHKIRQVDAQIAERPGLEEKLHLVAEKVPEIDSMLNQIRDEIVLILQMDNHLLDQAEVEKKKALKGLTQMRSKKQIAHIYGHLGPQSSNFVDEDQ
tara:strand:- start:95 stop:535 length:441 start_codon:yes stop_codon:yes gene_type:complete